MTHDDVIRELVAHRLRVGELLNTCVDELMARAVTHDASKFSQEELPHFAESIPVLNAVSYGTDEYRNHHGDEREEHRSDLRLTWLTHKGSYYQNHHWRHYYSYDQVP